jgi:uncharacterized radical SAM superfamily Fe-S cluster-containing enzyme
METNRTLPTRIDLRCPTCNKVLKDAPRTVYDPPTAVVMENQCDECVGGDFDDVHYYDAEGNEVSGDYTVFKTLPS